MKEEKSKKYRFLQALRILCQTAFFIIFIRLLFVTHYTGEDYIGNVDIFFHFNPLLALATTLASRAFFVPFVLALVTVAVTLILGRIACGWVCPLGAVHQFFSFLFKKGKLLKPRREQTGSLAWKYYILIFILLGALFTLDLAGLLDPLSLLYRSFAASVVPALKIGTSAFIGLLYSVRLTSLGDNLVQFMENLAVNATFSQGLFLGLLFMAIIILNISRERFWCRYLCPLGALLGFLSRWNIFKLKIDSRKCIQCHLCSMHCQTQATPFPEGKWKSAECVYCETCAAICPTGAIIFPLKAEPEKLASVDLSRRKVLLASCLALFSVPLFRISPSIKRASPHLIRPPGALAEDKFLRKCVKCGECLKVCPTNGLQPALTEAGPEGLWTPVLVPRIGYCEYFCSLCTQVCPTGAIKELTIEEKIEVKIGTAWIEKNRCIPYVLGNPCIVCEEHCPTSPKAIKLIRTEVRLPDGAVLTPLAPVIDKDICIGCGICENKCPVVDQPAIYVTSIGEERSERNQLLLQLFTEEPEF